MRYRTRTSPSTSVVVASMVMLWVVRLLELDVGAILHQRRERVPEQG